MVNSSSWNKDLQISVTLESCIVACCCTSTQQHDTILREDSLIELVQLTHLFVNVVLIQSLQNIFVTLHSISRSKKYRIH